MMKYAYLRAGGPILAWRNSAPLPSRAGETVSLGSLGETTLGASMPLPRPGAPEPIGDCGCGCGGGGGCAGAMHGLADAVPGGYLTLGILAGAVAVYLLKKKR